MFRLTIKELAAKKLRLVTTAIAVMLGVAFMAGTLVFSATLGAAFDGLLDHAYAGTDAVVRANSPIDAAMRPGASRLDEPRSSTSILEVDGVSAAEGHVSGYAQIIRPDGEPLGDPGERGTHARARMAAEPAAQPVPPGRGQRPGRGTARSSSTDSRRTTPTSASATSPRC